MSWSDRGESVFRALSFCQCHRTECSRSCAGDLVFRDLKALRLYTSGFAPPESPVLSLMTTRIDPLVSGVVFSPWHAGKKRTARHMRIRNNFPFFIFSSPFVKYLFTECDMNIARSMERQVLHCILDGLDHQGKCPCPWFHRFLGYMSDTSQGAVTTRLVVG